MRGRASEDARRSGTIRCEAAQLQVEGEATIPVMGATIDLDCVTDLEYAEEAKRDDSTRHIPMYCSKSSAVGYYQNPNFISELSVGPLDFCKRHTDKLLYPLHSAQLSRQNLHCQDLGDCTHEL